MIIEAIMNIFKFLIDSIFALLPNVPNIDLVESVNVAMGVIFENLQLLGVLVRPSTIILIVPVFIAIKNFQYIYHIYMWILAKIPMLSIK